MDNIPTTRSEEEEEVANAVLHLEYLLGRTSVDNPEDPEETAGEGSLLSEISEDKNKSLQRQQAFADYYQICADLSAVVNEYTEEETVQCNEDYAEPGTSGCNEDGDVNEVAIVESNQGSNENHDLSVTYGNKYVYGIYGEVNEEAFMKSKHASSEYNAFSGTFDNKYVYGIYGEVNEEAIMKSKHTSSEYNAFSGTFDSPWVYGDVNEKTPKEATVNHNEASIKDYSLPSTSGYSLLSKEILRQDKELLEQATVEHNDPDPQHQALAGTSDSSMIYRYENEETPQQEATGDQNEDDFPGTFDSPLISGNEDKQTSQEETLDHNEAWKNMYTEDDALLGTSGSSLICGSLLSYEQQKESIIRYNQASNQDHARQGTFGNSFISEELLWQDEELPEQATAELKDLDPQDQALPCTSGNSLISEEVVRQDKELPEQLTAEHKDPDPRDQALPGTSGGIHEELQKVYKSYCIEGENTAFEVFLLKELLRHPTLNHVIFCNFMNKDFFKNNYLSINVSLNGKIKEKVNCPMDIKILKQLDISKMASDCYEWILENKESLMLSNYYKFFLEHKESLFYDVLVEKGVWNDVESTRTEQWMIIKEIKYYSIKKSTTAYYFLNSDMDKKEIFCLKETKDAVVEDKKKMKSEGFTEKTEIIIDYELNLTKSGENRDDEVSDKYILPDTERDILYQLIKDKRSEFERKEEASLNKEKEDQENEKRQEEARRDRDKEIRELESRPHLSPEQEDRLRTLRLEQDFQRRSEELHGEEDSDEMTVDEDSPLHNDKVEKTNPEHIDDQLNNLEHDDTDNEKGLDEQIEEIIYLIKNLPVEKPSTEVDMLVFERYMMIGNENSYKHVSVLDEMQDVDNSCNSEAREVLEGIVDERAQNQVEGTRNNNEASIIAENNMDQEDHMDQEDQTNQEDHPNQEVHTNHEDCTLVNAEILAKKKQEEEEIRRRAKTQAKTERREAISFYREFLAKQWDANLEKEKQLVEKERQREERQRIKKQKLLEKESAELVKRKNRNPFPVSKRIRRIK